MASPLAKQTLFLLLLKILSIFFFFWSQLFTSGEKIYEESKMHFDAHWEKLKFKASPSSSFLTF